MASSPKTRSPEDPVRDDQQTRKVAAACQNIFGEISTTFGKLVALAGLQINGSGRYSHPRLDAFPTSLVDATLQQQHESAFSDWINLSLEEQHKQLAEFFQTMWTVGTPRLPKTVRQALAPVAAREAERTLFLTDLACAIELIERDDA